MLLCCCAAVGKSDARLLGKYLSVVKADTFPGPSLDKQLESDDERPVKVAPDDERPVKC